MRLIKKATSVMRVAGAWLVIAAVVLSIFSLTLSSSRWSEMKAVLDETGLDSGIVQRVQFDQRFYSAMAATTAVRPFFTVYSDQITAKAKKLSEEKAEKLVSGFEATFDFAAFSAALEQKEQNTEEQEAQEVIERLDASAQPAAKGGKALPKLQTTSCKDALYAAYQTMQGQFGEEAGSIAEFARTIEYMMSQSGATKAADFVASLDTTAYFEALAVIRAQEKTEKTENLLDRFAALVEAKNAGEQVDFPAFFRSEYELFCAQYGTGRAEFTYFVQAVQSLLQNVGSFGGGWQAVLDKAQSLKAEDTSYYNTAAVASFFNTFCQSVDTDRTSYSTISFIRPFWYALSFLWLIWTCGIFLLVLSAVSSKIWSNAILKHMKQDGGEQDGDVLLRVEHLKQYFKSGNYVTKAVDDVSFYIKKGEVFGLVGESGCGKTTTGRTIINLYDPTDGDVYFRGLRISSNLNGESVLISQLKKDCKGEIAALRKQQKEGKLTAAQCNEQIKALKKALSDKIEQAQINALQSSVEKNRCDKLYQEKCKAELTAAYEADKAAGLDTPERAKRYKDEMKAASKENIMTKMQMIFQDPIASINPRMTVREIIAEGLAIRGIKDKEYVNQRVNEMLELVGLVPEHADRYPHEFSGGQRQRIGIARAIIMEPDLIIADEPISALDVSIQAQVINLLNDLRNQMGLTIMFIAHNLSVVKYFSDRIAVMYFGKIVEMASSDELFNHPLHPYTKSLLSAIPYPDPTYEKHRKRISYKPEEVHDYSVDKPQLVEIVPEHFIYCNQAELEKYRQEMGV